MKTIRVPSVSAAEYKTRWVITVITPAAEYMIVMDNEDDAFIDKVYDAWRSSIGRSNIGNLAYKIQNADGIQEPVVIGLKDIVGISATKVV